MIDIRANGFPHAQPKKPKTGRASETDVMRGIVGCEKCEVEPRLKTGCLVLLDRMANSGQHTCFIKQTTDERYQQPSWPFNQLLRTNWQVL